MARRNTWRVPAAAVVALGLLTLGQGVAVAADDPAGDVTTTVKKHLDPVTGSDGKSAPAGPKSPSTNASTPSQPPGPPSSQDESGSNEVSDPGTPDHAGSDTLHTQLGGHEVSDLSNNRSTVEDDDSTKSDATLLALGGTEVTGAHADSDGRQHDQNAGLQEISDPVCEGSENAICFDILYADANATKTSSRSHSDGSSGVARFCIDGNGDTVECEAPAQGEVGGSATQIDRDRATGRTTASSESNLAELCLTSAGGLPLPLPLPDLPGGEGGCDFGLSALSSQGHSDSGGDHPSAGRSSSLVGFQAGGEEHGVSDPQAFELPPGCPVGGSLVCIYVNQGETYLGPGSVAGHAQEAVHADVAQGLVDGSDLLSLIGARTETLVHNDGGEPVTRTPEPRDVAGTHGTRAPARAAATVAGATARGGLPNTGGPAAGLLAGGLLAVGVGAILVSASRLRRFGIAS